MQTAFDVTALTKALQEADAFISALVQNETGTKPIGKPMVWIPINENQVQLVRRSEAVRPELQYMPELMAWAKETAEELNAILAQRGFSIRLVPWQKSRDRFGVVAVYDITIEWIEAGTIVNEETGRDYKLSNGKPAYRLDGKGAQVQFHNVDGRIIVKIPGTHEGDFLCITKADRPLRQFKLLEEAEKLRAAMSDRTRVRAFGGVVMPNVLFDVQPDISWLVGLRSVDAVGSPWSVEQAKMQVKFTMGRYGARTKVGVAVGFLRTSAVIEPKKPDYVVNHDVIIWKERQRVASEPFLVAYVTMDEFADHQVELSEID